MTSTLIIVVTRLHTDPDMGTDEFRTEWESGDNEHGRFFLLDEGKESALLLVHGHIHIRENFMEAFDSTIAEMSSDDRESLEQVAKDADIRLFVHGDDKQTNGLKGALDGFQIGERRFDSEVSYVKYSSRHRNSAILGLLDEIQQAYGERADHLCDAISQKCLRSARIQSLYLNQVRELLLALQLSAAVVNGLHTSDADKSAAVDDVHAISKQIRECLHRPVVMELINRLLEKKDNNPRSLVERLLAIWDLDEKDVMKTYNRHSQRGYFGNFEPNWRCPDFWNIVANSSTKRGAKFRPEVMQNRLSKVRLEELAGDFRFLALGVDEMLEAAASERDMG